jgi:riboflavin kinase/FMN adenylyltransferase
LRKGAGGETYFPRIQTCFPRIFVIVHFGFPAERLGAAALAIGSFDGLHLGHQSVLDCLRRAASVEGLQPVMVTFDPHPRCIVDPPNCPPMITTLEERLDLAGSLGVEHAIVLEFNRALAAEPPEEFMAHVLAAMDLRRLVAGGDFALGKGRAGNLDWLRAYGAEAGYAVEVVPPFRLDGEEVHSSEIRKHLILGEVDAANRLLGRAFTLSGLVLPGDRIGSQIGWPTVNLSVPAGKLVPARGIYAGWAVTPQGERMAGISIGYRPTFTSAELRVEAYLLDFAGDLYQQRLELRFLHWLHDEIRFSDMAQLSDQIARDVEATRRLLGRSR